MELDIGTEQSPLEVVYKWSRQKIDVTTIESLLWQLPRFDVSVKETLNKYWRQLGIALYINEGEEKETIVLVHLIELVSMVDIFKRLPHVKLDQANCPYPSEALEVLHGQEVEEDCVERRLHKT